MVAPGQTTLAFSFLLISITSAYNITFFSDTGCSNGNSLGTFIGGEGQGCQSRFVGSAQGALVTSTGPVDDDTMVQFYSTNDCLPGSETTSTSAFCAAIDGFGLGGYGSFKVIDDIVTPALEPDVTVSNDQQFAAATSAAASISQASIEKPVLGARDQWETNGTWSQSTDISWVPQDRTGPQNDHSQNRSGLVPPNMYHGKYSRVNGVLYRWHQIFDTGYTGVPASDWDPTKHKADNRSFEEVVAATDGDAQRAAPMSPNVSPRNALEERAFDFSRCQFAQTCGALANGVGDLSVAVLSSAIVKQTKALANKHGKPLWEFLNTPFVSAFTAQVIADRLGPAAPQGVTTVTQITGSAPSTIQDCSSTSTTGLDIAGVNEAIGSVIQSMASTTVTAAQTLAISWSGTLVVTPVPRRGLGSHARRQVSTQGDFKVAMDVVSCGVDFSGQLCGLTTRLCEF